MAAKGSTVAGDLNTEGHAAREKHAAESNLRRTGGSDWDHKRNDKRSDEQKQRMGNAARVDARSAPGGDD